MWLAFFMPERQRPSLLGRDNSPKQQMHLLNCINPVSYFAGSRKTAYANRNNAIKPGILGVACFK